jgi:sulfite exporter TauE/SafE
MSALLPLVLTALVLGAQHSFGPDHVAAVGLFVSRRPGWRRALGLGVRWGVGHSATILVLGGLIALSGLRLPQRFEPTMERAVGVVLIALGVAALWRARRMHGHWHEHGGDEHWHVHGHARQGAGAPAASGGHREAHDHDHQALLGIGMLHGLAGTGAVALMISSATPTASHALAFLAAFGVGTTIAMALFGAAAGWALAAAGRRSTVVARGASVAAAVGGIAVGAWWLLAGGA